MKMSMFLKGLEILNQYYGEDGYHLGAGHDVVYAYPPNKPMTPEHVQEMINLGWTQDVEFSGDDGDKMLVQDYNPEGSWWAHI